MEDNYPHKRYNPLTNSWVLVSPHRTKRPWQGQVEKLAEDTRPQYDPMCYLCAGNARMNGKINPNYTSQMYLGTDGGVYMSNDRGATWIMLSSLPVSQFYHVVYDMKEPYN